MPRIWTEQQSQAINARGASIIVSAAAGSGKTSVLVERLLKLISNFEEQIPADRIAVVTFTNDAAAEMKQRLSAGISQMIESEPENYWLMEQQSLLQSAKISTIHSFCFDLIRENVQELGISSGFRIIDGIEEKVIFSQAMSNTMEEFYKNRHEVIDSLVNFFCIKGDKALEKNIEKLHKFIMSIPFYVTWLENAAAKFDTGAQIICDEWIDGYFQFVSENFQKFAADARTASEIASEIGATAAEELLETEFDQFEKIADAVICHEKKLDDRLRMISIPKFNRMDFPKSIKDAGNLDEVEFIKKIRNKYKLDIKKICEECAFTAEEIAADASVQKSILSNLIELLAALESEFRRLCDAKNGLCFSDAEQFAVRLLARKDTNGRIFKTQLGIELSDFYKIIMIDEFQDANSNQDLIFKMLSNKGDSENNGNNMFLVGDVKQSIYGFRLANPAIFIHTLDKYQSYDEKRPIENSKILLNKNFRSRRQIIDFVNYIFENIMTSEVGDVMYDSHERLVFGANFDDDGGKSEIILVGTDGEACKNSNDDDGEILQEARCVAKKISLMIRSGVEIEDNGIRRKCINSDFCILLRNKKKSGEFVKELNLLGIKAVGDDIEGYLKSREISVLLNLLQVINNPLQDIPLVSVLMSPMFLLSAEEIAKIRIIFPKGNLYKGISVITGRIIPDNEIVIENEESYYNKLVSFMKILDELRIIASSYNLERLIREIYDSTDFLSVVQIYKNGAQKKANLHLLLEYARNFDSNINGGLSGFLRYIAAVTAHGGDLRRAGTVSDFENAVSVKTIHKSKGLEFPFVFLCGTSTKFNQIDLAQQMQINLTEGIGFKIQEKKLYKRYNSLPYIAIKEKNLNNLLGEEMRLMYVALTRAKEKLFITIKNDESFKENLCKTANYINAAGKIDPIFIKNCKSMQEWLLACLVLHPDCGLLREMANVNMNCLATNVHIDLQVFDREISNKIDINGKEKASLDAGLLKKLRDDCFYKYNDILSKIPAKLTVSEIIKDDGLHELTLRKPRFTQESRGLTAAEVGTATHTFMQFANYNNAFKDLLSERERLVLAGYLTKKQAENVSLKYLKGFFSSPIFSRISNCANVHREQKFLIRIDELGLKDELGQRYTGTDGMLQGIADCVFEEEDGLVLLDYKTDFVKSRDDLIKLYARQLEIYRIALGVIYEKIVKEVYIYSFFLGENIQLFP